jgi:DNA-binding GntR family transcriptional regulator
MLRPLTQVQLGDRVYQAVLDKIVTGELAFGAQLRADLLAEQLEVSTTPVRDALNRLEKDGLVVKPPYQSWFVRDFGEQEIRNLYELRAGLECFSVRLACARITPAELDLLREQQRKGESALKRQRMDSYRIYNQDLHAGIMQAAKNSQLISVASQISLQIQMLAAKTIGVSGRPTRALQEHARLIELVAVKDARGAEELMERHILTALEDILAALREGNLPARVRGAMNGRPGRDRAARKA